MAASASKTCLAVDGGGVRSQGPVNKVKVWFCVAWFGSVSLGSVRCGLAWLGLAWLGLAWLGLAWLGLAWLGLAWLGLAWLGLAWRSVSVSKSCKIDLFYDYFQFQFSTLLDIGGR